MKNTISKASSGEWASVARYLIVLVLIVGGIFGYFSVTGCGEPTSGCGGQVGSSDYSSPSSINSPPYSISVSGSGSARVQPVGTGGVLEMAAVLPGSEITRDISYSAAPGNDPTTIVWAPPEGAANFIFNHTPAPGGPPFVFDNDPPLTLPIHITYSAPQLPTYRDTQVVGETFRASKVGSTDDVHVLNYTISRSGAAAQAAFNPSSPTTPTGVTNSTTISAKEVQRWYGAPGKTMDTALCQQVFDWLQSDQTFAAMRLPVSVGSDPSYELPVLFPASGAAGAPKVRLEVNGMPFAGTPSLPLEMRSDRITYMENSLPSASGEHWVALGVNQANKVTCPTGLNLTHWEFYFEYPVNPAAPINAFPLYYCQEGQNPPPMGGTIPSPLMSLKKEVNAPGVQVEGITCLGPYEQNINTAPVIAVGHPNTLWNKYPLDEIRLKHYVQVIGLAPTIKFIISSDLAGFGWKLYEGDDNAPNLSKEVDMTQAYTALPTMMFFWMIGTVPAGTSPGPHTFSLRVEKSDDSSKYGLSTDLVWVGSWVAPPPPGGKIFGIYVPLVRK
jgi:hypothetical protein